MADTTKQSSSFDWGSLFNAAAAILGAHQSQQTPNFYTAPLTPNEQWTTDAKKNLFDYSSAYADQYLRGLGNLNPDYKLNTDAVGNPAFMGGVKVPVVDWSKMPARPSSGATTATPPKPPMADQGSPNDGIAGDPFGSIAAPAGSSGDPFGDWPTPGSQATSNTTWDDIKKFGPQAIALATSFLGQGIPLMAIYNFIKSKFGGGNQYTGNPNPTGAKWNALTPEGNIREKVNPGFASGAAAGFNSGQENRLANDPNQMAPERLGGGQGFGYGMRYDDEIPRGGPRGGLRGRGL